MIQCMTLNACSMNVNVLFTSFFFSFPCIIVVVRKLKQRIVCGVGAGASQICQFGHFYDFYIHIY